MEAKYLVLFTAAIAVASAASLPKTIPIKDCGK